MLIGWLTMVLGVDWLDEDENDTQHTVPLRRIRGCPPQVPIKRGENWASGEAAAGNDGGMRKLVLTHNVEGVLGTIYLDLHRFVKRGVGGEISISFARSC